MKITIIYDNESYEKELRADWGFACLVEVEDTPKILFDTGADGNILLSNMERLHIDPKAIEEVFISHGHFDHIGGLSAFLKVNSDVKLYVPVSVLGAAYGAREITGVKEPFQIHDRVYSTGELDHIEQSMAVKTEQGGVVIVGCSHPTMTHILGAASQFGTVYAIIGGLHGFKQFDLFENFGLICPAHCTQHKQQLRALYPNTYTDGGVGRIIQI
jgi:7,8-dihydropterin-6-yl-methyl-4-(beta-D-ribofuranosyl)aminobenzene 5'-phosphate synthase